MYDPKTGRWISQDPLGFTAGDTNLYRYVGNSPTNATDPRGLEPLPLTPPIVFQNADTGITYSEYVEPAGIVQNPIETRYWPDRTYGGGRVEIPGGPAGFVYV